MSQTLLSKNKGIRVSRLADVLNILIYYITSRFSDHGLFPAGGRAQPGQGTAGEGRGAHGGRSRGGGRGSWRRALHAHQDQVRPSLMYFRATLADG